MGILKKLASIFNPTPSLESRSYYIYVECNRCGEKIATRVDLFNDLSPVYHENSLTFFCRKVIMGQQHCFQKVEVEVEFDSNRRVTDRRISGGKFITKEQMPVQVQ